jgi:plastocyanin
MGLAVAMALGSGCSSKGGGGTTAPPPGGGLELNSGSLGNGVSYSHTFNSAGTFPYHCDFHPTMRDTIRVDASSPNASVAISITGSAFVPTGSTVVPGGTVTWTNNDGGIAHTVTSD